MVVQAYILIQTESARRRMSRARSRTSRSHARRGRRRPYDGSCGPGPSVDELGKLVVARVQGSTASRARSPADDPHLITTSRRRRPSRRLHGAPGVVVLVITLLLGGAGSAPCRSRPTSLSRGTSAACAALSENPGRRLRRRAPRHRIRPVRTYLGSDPRRAALRVPLPAGYGLTLRLLGRRNRLVPVDGGRRSSRPQIALSTWRWPFPTTTLPRPTSSPTSPPRSSTSPRNAWPDGGSRGRWWPGHRRSHRGTSRSH